MIQTQLSIFLENKKGRLHEVCSLFASQGINIRALTVAETESFGVLRVLVKDPHHAATVLKDHGLIVHETEVVAVEVDDKPGGLAKVLGSIAKHHINVEYMYGFVEPSSKKAVMVFRFDNSMKAAEALKSDGIRVMGKKDLGDI